MHSNLSLLDGIKFEKISSAITLVKLLIIYLKRLLKLSILNQFFFNLLQQVLTRLSQVVF